MNVLKHRSHINGKMLSLHEQYMMCHSMNQCDNTWEGFHLYFMFGFALIFCLNLIICGQDTVRIKLQTFPTMIMSSRCITVTHRFDSHNGVTMFTLSKSNI